MTGIRLWPINYTLGKQSCKRPVEAINIQGDEIEMSQTNPVQTQSANLKAAIRWLSDILQEHPEKERQQVLRDAQLRFDLSPAECEFLDKNFGELAAGTLC